MVVNQGLKTWSSVSAFSGGHFADDFYSIPVTSSTLAAALRATNRDPVKSATTRPATRVAGTLVEPVGSHVLRDADREGGVGDTFGTNVICGQEHHRRRQVRLIKVHG